MHHFRFLIAWKEARLDFVRKIERVQEICDGAEIELAPEAAEFWNSLLTKADNLHALSDDRYFKSLWGLDNKGNTDGTQKPN